MQDLYEAYLGIYEAKVDKGTPLEKEDIRNKRAFGSTSSKDRATGVRRFHHGVQRGLKKDKPYGNEPSELSSRFGTGAEVRREIRKLKSRKRGREIAKQSKIDREAREYIALSNSKFNFDTAQNKIVPLRKEELEFILAYLVSECYADDYKSANYILESMSDEWIDSILCEEWRAADTGKISTQAYKKEKRGDPDSETLDVVTRNLLSKNTKPPTERNLMGRRLQLARLSAANDKDHKSIMDIASTKNMKDPKNQQQVLNIAGNVSRRGKLAHAINTVANMQTRRTPKEQDAQAASIRFHDILRTKR